MHRFPIKAGALPRFRRRVAVLALFSMAAGTATALAASPAMAAVACDVTYTTNDWQGGFTASVSVKNLGDPLTAWTLGFNFPTTTQKLRRAGAPTGRRAARRSPPRTWTGTAASPPAPRPASASTAPGPGPTPSRPPSRSTAPPAAGHPVNQPPTATITSPSAGATFTAPATVAIAASAADSDGTVAKVDFFNGTTLLGQRHHRALRLQLGERRGRQLLAHRQGDRRQGRGHDLRPRRDHRHGHLHSARWSSPRPRSPSPRAPTRTCRVKLSRAPTANVTVTTAQDERRHRPDRLRRRVADLHPVELEHRPDGDDRRRRGRRPATGSGDVHLDRHRPRPRPRSTATEVDNDSTGGDNEYIAAVPDAVQQDQRPGQRLLLAPRACPYHSVETLIVEAPDHGHETTSEAYSYCSGWRPCTAR